MKLVYFSNEFPHDDLQDLARRLHLHGKDRNHAILARFIEEATLAVREEGIGLLAAAAVSLSSTLADIVVAGAEVVRLAFRLGILVDEVSQDLHTPDWTATGAPDSWAYVLPYVTAEDVQRELDEIHKREKTPETSKVFISARNKTSVAISGPSARLRGVLRLSDFFCDRRSVALPVYAGLCHAEHIYNSSHVHTVVRTNSIDLLSSKLSPAVAIFSTNTGRPFKADTAEQLFDNVITEILTQRIEWDNVMGGIIDRARNIGASECQISERKTNSRGPRGLAQSKIAIVGMSCRMPSGATNTEKFWKLLEDGLDVHRKIPADRFDVDIHYDPSGKGVNASHTPYGCFIAEPGLFDAPFFNMSPREAQQTDPMQRLALVKAYEALREPDMLRTGQLPRIFFCASYVRRATREPVKFLSPLQKAQNISSVDDTTVWFEIGPHPVSTGFVRSSMPHVNVTVPSMRRGEDNWTTMAGSLAALHCAGVEINWNEFHRPFEPVLRLLDLPIYAWNDKNYWIQCNGDWALTKGNTYYDSEKAALAGPKTASPVSRLNTSAIQKIIDESFTGTTGRVRMQSDLIQPDFYAAAYGHKMNGCGVVTFSIQADIAFTLGSYVYKELVPGANDMHMNMCNLEVTKGLVAQKSTKSPQYIQVSASTADISTGILNLKCEFLALTHLVQGWIEALERLAEEGVANKFSRNMAYRLFANNLVYHADKYRGMQKVVLHGFEAYADVQLTTEKGGSWTVPPYFIDSVAHLAGFIMNVSDAFDTKANFCVTPGWDSVRFAKPLTAGARYRSYVKTIPTTEDPTVYLGDVYILQDDIIIGMMRLAQSIRPSQKVRKSHDETCSTFPKEFKVTSPHHGNSQLAKPPNVPVSIPTPAPSPPPTVPVKVQSVVNGVTANTSLSIDSDSTAAKAIALIATEAALDLADLQDDATFANLGVESLMGLVTAEKFREELGAVVTGSLFLEYPSVGDLRSWLVEYYS
ncbi:ketoacyl-synt-domain-containing protein [Delitschia confertaspora ATCC 74209]|uniref:Ketoacyl-synt-domain-containing protein n=1 Tax=Delitschia confertaspora ATCC 74209 TaxID=1513339 RepID=A0A9P4MTW5_9PLEO|nr:ketoacyl-synt-domain-containing protein [Delitschia confertaspora ATCC 74209]